MLPVGLLALAPPLMAMTRLKGWGLEMREVALAVQAEVLLETIEAQHLQTLAV